jgi:Caudovirus prohead serine protease
MRIDYKSIGGQIKAIDSQRPVVTAMVSTTNIDRDGEIVLASAFVQDLPIYMASPLLAWQHPWSFEESPKPSDALGHALDVRVTVETDDGGGFVEMDFIYDVDINPAARQVFDSVKAGTIRGYSVGFFSHESVTRTSPKDSIEALPRFAREALTSGACSRVHTRVELFEVSQVLIGSNRESLAALRALRNGQTTEEAQAVANTQPTQAIEPNAKAGHAPTNDIKARLCGAYDSLCAGWDNDENEPPEPEVCFGVIRVLEQVIEDLKVLAQADDDDTALAPEVVSTSAPAGQAKYGRRLSGRSMEMLVKAMEHHENGMKCMRSLLTDDFDADEGDDIDGERDEQQYTTDMDQARSITLQRTIAQLFDQHYRQR